MECQVQVSDAQPCHRCGGELYLTINMPHAGICNTRGERTGGRRVVGLCPRCDAQDPTSQPLLAYFAIHGGVELEDTEEFVRMLDDWVRARPGSEVSDEQLEQDFQEWRRDGFNM